MSGMFDIVCYLGGTCGDLVVAMIDTSNAVVENGAVKIDMERQRLKKSWQFQSDQDRNLYVESMQCQYRSIPSHDPDYHLRNNQSFIAVVVKEKSTAKWAAQRFKDLHKTHIWQEMQSVNNANSIEKYAQDMLDWSSWIKQHTVQTISVEDIINGRAHDALSSIIAIDAKGINFYSQWLQVQNEISNNRNQGRG
jgi:hypothetical protein